VRKHIFFDEENADAEEQEIIEIKHINKASLDAASEIVAQSPDVDNVDNVFHKHCSSLLALSSHPYSAFSSFDSWSTEVESLFAVSKLAEASFGEVYRLSLLDDIPDFSKADESVFKIIALKGPASTHPSDKRKRAALLKREELMSTPADVANEVRLLQRMTHIPGFTNFRDIRILQGRPSGPFITAFHDFDKKQRARGKEGSHFPDPAKKSSYAETQLWAIIEMQDAGSDLERLVEAKQCTSIWGTWDLFWHTTLALAKGEQGARFEHRDLHLGNICVRNLPGESSITEMEKIGDWLAEDVDMKRKLAFTPLETTIIDYTLSRATLKSIDDDGDEDEIEDEKNIAYMDLSRDPAIFQGDSTDEYQYDIYRYMRGVLYHDDAYHDFEANDQAERNQKADVEASPRSWSQYHPQTNLVWLHFILYMLLEQVIWPSETRAPTKRPGKTNRDEQARHKLRVAKHKRGKQLEAVLLELQAILDPEQICANGVRSAGDLVALAMSEGWLDLQDVIGRSMELVDGEEELEVEFEALKL
jgi:serine/threonine-protein kinase haspin